MGRWTKVYKNGPGHRTKLATMPIFGKNLLKSSSPEQRGLKLYQKKIFYENDDPWLTLTYFKARSNLVACVFEWEKGCYKVI